MTITESVQDAVALVLASERGDLAGAMSILQPMAADDVRTLAVALADLAAVLGRHAVSGNDVTLEQILQQTALAYAMGAPEL